MKTAHLTTIASQKMNVIVLCNSFRANYKRYIHLSFTLLQDITAHSGFNLRKRRDTFKRKQKRTKCKNITYKAIKQNGGEETVREKPQFPNLC